MSSIESNNALRAALYARVCSDLQSADSIEDQLRMCKECAAKQRCEPTPYAGPVPP